MCPKTKLKRCQPLTFTFVVVFDASAFTFERTATTTTTKQHYNDGNNKREGKKTLISCCSTSLLLLLSLFTIIVIVFVAFYFCSLLVCIYTNSIKHARTHTHPYKSVLFYYDVPYFYLPLISSSGGKVLNSN